MIISLDDSWFLLIAKICILLLSLGILLRLIKLSLWNSLIRYEVLCANLKSGKYFLGGKDFIAYAVNIAFIWLMLQGMTILILGCFGLSPQQLVLWHYQEFCLIAGIVLVILSTVKNRLIEKFRN